MDLNLRKIASTALVVIAVELAVAALYFRLAGGPAVNTFAVAVVLAVAALVGRAAAVGSRSAVAFAIALVASVWLFVSAWALAGTPTGLLANDLVFSVLAFGFACAPFEDRPGTVDAG